MTYRHLNFFEKPNIFHCCFNFLNSTHTAQLDSYKSEICYGNERKRLVVQLINFIHQTATTLADSFDLENFILRYLLTYLLSLLKIVKLYIFMQSVLFFCNESAEYIQLDYLLKMVSSSLSYAGSINKKRIQES